MTTVRKYQNSDYREIYNMLKQENVSDDEMVFGENETYVLENGAVCGFYTLYEQHRCHALAHFCVRKDKRSYDIIWKLLRDFEGRINKCFLHSDKEYLDKLIQWRYKVEPYARDKRYRYYFVEVRKWEQK